MMIMLATAILANQLSEELEFIAAGLTEPGPDASLDITLVDMKELASREIWVTRLRKAAEVAEGRLAVIRGQLVYADYFPKDADPT
jgi:hypothetical protein